MPSGRPHIVVVDDDPNVLGLFSELLSKSGFAVTAVASSSTVLEILRDQAIDLLILDLNMPEPDGFELLKMVRQVMPGLPMLVISGYMQGALLKTAELLGATASLDKTDAPKALVKTVKALLRKRAPRESPARG